MAIVVVAGAVALPAPASAGHAVAGCRLDPLPTKGPDVAVAGVVAGAPGEAVAVRCVLRSGGTVRALTPWSAGTTVAAAAAVAPLWAYDPRVLCAEYVTAEGPGEACGAVGDHDVDQAVWAAYEVLVDELVEWRYMDATLCPVFQSLTGSYGPVEIRHGTGGTGGDVYVAGTLVWDCPPYESSPE